jgi:hypothetical protein
MKKIILILAVLISNSVMAQSFLSSYSIDMICGTATKASNGKMFKRFEPEYFGLNGKYVLKTKFENSIGIKVSGKDIDLYDETTYVPEQLNTTFTYFRTISKFRFFKKSLKKILKKNSRIKVPVYTCTGYIMVAPFKDLGAFVFSSTQSIEEAKTKMRKHAEKNLKWKLN